MIETILLWIGDDKYSHHILIKFIYLLVNNFYNNRHLK